MECPIQPIPYPQSCPSIKSLQFRHKDAEQDCLCINESLSSPGNNNCGMQSAICKESIVLPAFLIDGLVFVKLRVRDSKNPPQIWPYKRSHTLEDSIYIFSSSTQAPTGVFLVCTSLCSGTQQVPALLTHTIMHQCSCQLKQCSILSSTMA